MGREELMMKGVEKDGELFLPVLYHVPEH